MSLRDQAAWDTHLATKWVSYLWHSSLPLTSEDCDRPISLRDQAAWDPHLATIWVSYLWHSSLPLTSEDCDRPISLRDQAAWDPHLATIWVSYLWHSSLPLTSEDCDRLMSLRDGPTQRVIMDTLSLPLWLPLRLVAHVGIISAIMQGSEKTCWCRHSLWQPEGQPRALRLLLCFLLCGFRK